jgi:predicted AlkP superfamily pyrophosphatase or phosphodiesterase
VRVRLRTRVVVVLLSLLLALAPWAPVARSQPRGVARVRGVLIVSVDGLRPDLILRAQAPVLRSLMDRGSFTLWAKTTALALTLPSHTSMLTGVSPMKHGILWNTELPLIRPIYPARPTLFELAKNAGFSTAMAVGKTKLSLLARPGTLDWAFVPRRDLPDSTVADTAVRWIAVHRPQVLFVHLAGVDTAGHKFGWGSSEQLTAVAMADRSIGRMLGALATQKLLDRTAVLVSADHGGAGTTHGPDDPRSRTIPWIIAGPGIRRNFDLSTADVDVRTEDSFATLCYLLGVPSPQAIDGRPVIEIMAPPAPARR